MCRYFLVACILLLWSQSDAQDLIKVKNIDEIEEGRISSIEKKYLSYYKADDPEGEEYTITRKFISWFRPESWTKNRFVLTATIAGLSPVGTGGALRKYMEENGYSGSSPGFLFGPVDYPTYTINFPYMIGLEYISKIQHAISFEFANTNSGRVRGLGTPEVNFRNYQFQLSYKYYLKSLRTSFQVGPLLNQNKITYSFPDGSEQGRLLPGVMIGLSGSIVEKRTFTMRLIAQYKYIQSVTTEGHEGILENETVSLQNLFFGLQIGVKKDRF